MNRAVELKWVGPLTFRGVLEQAEKLPRSGVYIHKEIHPDHTAIIYVGKATASTTIGKRHLQHHTSGLGGMYFLPHRYRNQTEDDWILDCQREEVLPTLFDPKRFGTLVAQYLEYVRHIQIFVAAYDGPDLEVLEKELIFFLQPETNRNHKRRLPRNAIPFRNTGALKELNSGLPSERTMKEEYLSEQSPSPYGRPTAGLASGEAQR